MTNDSGSIDKVTIMEMMVVVPSIAEITSGISTTRYGTLPDSIVSDWIDIAVADERSDTLL